MKTIAHYKSFAGDVKYLQHDSAACGCPMTFSVYLPTQSQEKNCPAIFWLSGLTCNYENFITKAGAQQYADQHGVVLIMPDTSPRDVGIAAADVDYDLGYGAGFYVNATETPWQRNFNMYDYITDELIPQCIDTLPIDADKLSIMGHSMGGHGALMLALRNPTLFKSVSAFAPIVAPSQVPWGQKAFTAYLGTDQANWQQYDSCDLISQTNVFLPTRIEQGSADQFLTQELQPQRLLTVAAEKNYAVDYYLREGFDHSYYFIASFIGEHIDFHMQYL